MKATEFLVQGVVCAKQRWDDISPHTRVLFVPPNTDQYVSNRTIWHNLPREEHIVLDKFTDGSRYILIGYGPETDTLIIAEPENEE